MCTQSRKLLDSLSYRYNVTVVAISTDGVVGRPANVSVTTLAASATAAPDTASSSSSGSSSSTVTALVVGIVLGLLVLFVVVCSHSCAHILLDLFDF